MRQTRILSGFCEDGGMDESLPQWRWALPWAEEGTPSVCESAAHGLKRTFTHAPLALR